MDAVASQGPLPTRRNFLRNHLPDIAAIDMFVVATATFQLLYGLIVLSLDRRRVVHFEVTQNPPQAWLSGQMTEAFPWRLMIAIAFLLVRVLCNGPIAFGMEKILFVMVNGA
jgi:hypothetical protein